MKLYDKNTLKHSFALIMIGILLVPTLIFAINTVETGFKIDTTKREIDAHSICKETYVTSGSNEYFVPTKTEPEWTAFRNFKPSDVALNVCPSEICLASSSTYPAQEHSSTKRTTTNGKWIVDSYQCLQPWTIDEFAHDHNDDERSGNQLSITVDICNWLPSLNNGDNFFVTSDVAGGSWVESGGGSRFTTARFKKGTAAANSEIKNSNSADSKDHYSWREYDGNCTVTLRSRQGYENGNRTNSHDQHITLFNIGFDLYYGGEETGPFYECFTGTCVLSNSGIINGSCSPADGMFYQNASQVNTDGLCSSGTASPSSVSGSAPWSWSCLGTTGGTDASCSADYAPYNWEFLSSGPNPEPGSYLCPDNGNGCFNSGEKCYQAQEYSNSNTSGTTYVNFICN